MSFSSEVDDFILDFRDRSDEVIRSTAIALFGAIIKSSPVDEGTFRSNWYVTADRPSNQVNPNASISQGAAIETMATVVSGLPSYKRIILANNLPYAEVIEFGGYPDPVKKGTFVKGKGYVKKSAGGYSKQAPKGVVRTNVLRFRNIFEQQAKKNGFQ